MLIKPPKTNKTSLFLKDEVPSSSDSYSINVREKFKMKRDSILVAGRDDCNEVGGTVFKEVAKVSLPWI